MSVFFDMGNIIVLLLYHTLRNNVKTIEVQACFDGAWLIFKHRLIFEINCTVNTLLKCVLQFIFKGLIMYSTLS